MYTSVYENIKEAKKMGEKSAMMKMQKVGIAGAFEHVKAVGE